MSGEAKKIPTIIQSALTNGGSRAVVRTHLSASATAFPHFHKTFSETFKVLSGRISVYMSPDISSESNLQLSRRDLTVGQWATVPPKYLHKYIVGDSQPAEIELSFDPGSVDFERGMCILRGLQNESPDVVEGNIGILAIIAKLTDANPVGVMKTKMEEVMLENDWLANMEHLIQRYAKDEDILKTIKRTSCG